MSDTCHACWETTEKVNHVIGRTNVDYSDFLDAYNLIHEQHQIGIEEGSGA